MKNFKTVICGLLLACGSVCVGQDDRGIDAIATGYGNGIYGQARLRILKFGPMDPAQEKSINEDTAILNHLLSKAIKLRFKSNSLGVPVSRAFGQNEIMYVEGRGLIFSYSTGLVVAPYQVDDEQEAEPKSPPSQWEAAKAEMDQSSLAIDVRSVPILGNMARSSRLSGLTADASLRPQKNLYDAEAVSYLMSATKKALQEIGNIRDLRSDESVTVFIQGPQQLVNNAIQVSTIAFEVPVSAVDSSGKVDSGAIKVKQYYRRSAAKTVFRSPTR